MIPVMAGSHELYRAWLKDCDRDKNTHYHVWRKEQLEDLKGEQILLATQYQENAAYHTAVKRGLI